MTESMPQQIGGRAMSRDYEIQDMPTLAYILCL